MLPQVEVVRGDWPLAAERREEIAIPNSEDAVGPQLKNAKLIHVSKYNFLEKTLSYTSEGLVS